MPSALAPILDSTLCCRFCGISCFSWGRLIVYYFPDWIWSEAGWNGRWKDRGFIFLRFWVGGGFLRFHPMAHRYTIISEYYFFPIVGIFEKQSLSRFRTIFRITLRSRPTLFGAGCMVCALEMASWSIDSTTLLIYPPHFCRGRPFLY